MSETQKFSHFPPWALAGAGMLIMTSIVAAGAASHYGIGSTRHSHGGVATARDLVFEDVAGGSIRVSDAQSGQSIESFEPGSGGFVRVVLRGLARDRAISGTGAGAAIPFRLSRYADGTVLIEDAVTGRAVNVGAFGPDNSRVFETLFEKGR